MMSWIALMLLVAIGGAQITLRSFLVSHAKKIFFASGVIIFVALIYISYQHYQAWELDSFSKNLLPPHTPITYFLFYVFTRFFSPYVLSLGFGGLFFWMAKKYNASKEEVLFHKEELWMMMLALFLVGWPGVLVYGVLFFLVFVCASALNTIRYGTSYRTTSYYLWIPTAILVILISELYLKHTALWLLLNI